LGIAESAPVEQGKNPKGKFRKVNSIKMIVIDGLCFETIDNQAKANRNKML
jgi:hypothetical protein